MKTNKERFDQYMKDIRKNQQAVNLIKECYKSKIEYYENEMSHIKFSSIDEIKEWLQYRTDKKVIEMKELIEWEEDVEVPVTEMLAVHVHIVALGHLIARYIAWENNLKDL